MARKRKQQKLDSEELSKEFFGDASTAVPGQEEDDGTTSLAGAVAGTLADELTGRARGAGGGADAAPSPGASGGGGPAASSGAGEVPGRAAADAASGGESYSLFDDGKHSKQDFGPDYSGHSWFELRGENPELNPYVAAQKKRFGMDPRSEKMIRLGVLLVVVFLVALVMPTPDYNIEFSWSLGGFLTALQNNVSELLGSLTGDWHGQVTPYKACTYGIVVFAGAGLAITGAVYQGALKNALVSPTTLGVTAGGTMGASIFVMLAPLSVVSPFYALNSSYISSAQATDYYAGLDTATYILVTMGRQLASLAGCFIAVGLVLLVSFLVGRGRSTSYALIICGQVVMSIAMAVTEVIRYYLVETDLTGSKSAIVQQMQIGTIKQLSTPLDFLMVAVPVTLGVIVIVLLRRRLNVLAFSDEEARSMGVATERLRWTMVGVCTFITAIVISFCGNIAFVGFAIPLIVRRYIGPDFNYLLPASALAGGAFLVLSNCVADMDVFSAFGLAIPTSVSMLTSLVGAIVFAVVTIRNRREERNADWL